MNYGKCRLIWILLARFFKKNLKKKAVKEGSKTVEYRFVGDFDQILISRNFQYFQVSLISYSIDV